MQHFDLIAPRVDDVGGLGAATLFTLERLLEGCAVGDGANLRM